MFKLAAGVLLIASWASSVILLGSGAIVDLLLVLALISFFVHLVSARRVSA